MSNLAVLHEAIYKGQIGKMAGLVQKEIESGTPIRAIIDDGLIWAMGVIGKKFKNNEIFIPEVLISAKAMQAGMKVLEPHLVKNDIRPFAKVVIGTVKGDLHDIGKNIVAMMFKGAGFEVTDLGIDVQPKKFADACRQSQVDILAMSSLLTTSMNTMSETIQMLTASGLRESVKVMVGGAPVTQEFANRIGADGYARDAASAVDRAKELLRKT